MSEHEQDHETEQPKVATREERLWAGISLALAVASLFGAMLLDIAHGSSQWQATCVVAFVGYLFAACVIGSQGDAFVEHEEPSK